MKRSERPRRTALCLMIALLAALAIFSAGCDSGGSYHIKSDVPEQDARALYREYFKEHYDGANAQVVLAEVTGDSTQEMIVVSFGDDESVRGEVYTIFESGISHLYTIQGAEVHAGGFFNWFLRPLGDGHCSLVEEISDMWQGDGVIGWREYTLTGNGDKKIREEYVIDSNDPDYGDASGRITDEAFEQFTDDLTEYLSDCQTLYATISAAKELPEGCMQSGSTYFSD